MINQIVSVRDSAMQAYSRPIFVPSLGVAMRSFTDEVNNPDSPMNKHPDDYILFHIGTFDEETGIFLQEQQARQLLRAKDCINTDTGDRQS